MRRLGKSLGNRLPATIARKARLQEDQFVELSVVEGGVLIRPMQPRLSLTERLAAYKPMAGEPTEAMDGDVIWIDPNPQATSVRP